MRRNSSAPAVSRVAGTSTTFLMDEHIDDLREKLVARVDRCYDRLDDVVSELVALHGVEAELILDRVDAVIAAEQRESRV
jgi:hypothetical protein